MMGMCKTCGVRPQYRDGTKTHPYCGKTCAKKAATGSAPAIMTGPQTNGQPMIHPSAFMNPSASSSNGTFGPPGICAIQTCNKPVWINPRTGKPSPYCGNTCRGNAANLTASLGTSACLQCRVRPQNAQFPDSLFCSQGCKAQAENSAPGILEIPPGHPKFNSVAKQFNDTWKHTNIAGKVASRVYLVLNSSAQMAHYNAHRQAVEAKGNFTAKGRAPGNENRRWHGTKRKCLLGDPGHTQLCSDSTCALCCIVRTSFDIAFYKNNTSWGRFGCGIYSSSTSSKSDSYSANTQTSPLKAMLLNKVVVGRGQIVNQDSPNLTAPAAGFDSVLGEPGGGGVLNFDECVVYTNDAIRPAYLVMY